jgi:hypothetical protein
MSVRSATFVTLNISNVGKASIDQQTEPWTLQVSGPPEATLVVLDLSALVEARTVMSQADSPAQNAIALRIGLLMPHAAIQMRLLVLNADDPPPRLLATSSLPGLPQPPAVTEFSPNKLVALRLTGWLWPAFAALLAFELIGDFRRQRAELRQHRWGQARFLAGRLLLLPLLAAFAAFAIGHGIAWLVAKAIDLGVTG